MAALVLALHHDIGREVRDSDRGGRLVDVLPALPRSPVHIDSQIVVVDLDFDVLIHHRVHEHRRERRVAPRLRVERGNAHQAVHALFGLEQPVRVLPADLDFRGLDTGFLALQQVEDLDLETVALRPARIHPHQHFGPVLGLGTARA